MDNINGSFVALKLVRPDKIMSIGFLEIFIVFAVWERWIKFVAGNYIFPVSKTLPVSVSLKGGSPMRFSMHIFTVLYPSLLLE